MAAFPCSHRSFVERDVKYRGGAPDCYFGRHNPLGATITSLASPRRRNLVDGERLT